MVNPLLLQVARRITLLVLLCFGIQSFAYDDAEKFRDQRIAICTGKDTMIEGGAVNGGGTSAPTVDTDKRRNCYRTMMRDAEKKRKACPKSSTECKNAYSEIMADIQSDQSLNNYAGEQRKEKCESIYSDDQDIYKECSKPSAKKAQYCAKFESKDEEGGFLQSETMQGMAPFLTMVNGADTLLQVYGAMSSKPECSLSKEDFLNEKDKLQTQSEKAEENIKETMKEAEDAQADFTKELEAWTDREGKIADELAAIPLKAQDEKYKLSKEKIKLKMQVDEEYAKITSQIAAARGEINKIVDEKAVAMKALSEFAIHDKCAEEAVNGPAAAKKDAANKQASAGVQASFAGAFAKGKILATNIQKRYDNCVSRESTIANQVRNNYARNLESMRSTIKSLEASFGSISEKKLMADQDITVAMQNIDRDSGAEVNKLRNEYLTIQTKKAKAQSDLKTKLERLGADVKKEQQKLAILKLKLQQYSGKVPATTTDGKSMGELSRQCGQDYKDMIKYFGQTCCENGTYTGQGSSICRMKYDDSKPGTESTAKGKAKSGTKSGGNAD